MFDVYKQFSVTICMLISGMHFQLFHSSRKSNGKFEILGAPYDGFLPHPHIKLHIYVLIHLITKK